MTAGARRAGVTALMAVLAALPSRGLAQDRPQAVTADTVGVRVDYLAGTNAYLSAGERAGIAAGDTLAVLPARDGAPLGRLRVIASSDERSVVTFAGAPFALTRGDSLRVVRVSVRKIALPATETVADRAAQSDTNPAAGAHPTAPAARTRVASADAAGSRWPGPRVAGRISLDMDALHSRASWGPAPEDASERRSYSPVVRLNARVAGLPGGAEMVVSARWASRLPQSTGPAALRTTQVYQASLRKTFDRFPVAFEIGRFYDLHDPWGGYVDGVLLRFGRALGAGVVAGFVPDRAAGSIDTQASRWGAFIAYDVRRPDLSWASTAAFYSAAPADGATERTLAWSQRLRWNALNLSTRLRARQGAPATPWRLEQADVDAFITVVNGVQLRGSWSRQQYAWVVLDPADTLLAPPGTFAARRERTGAGLLWSGRAGSFTLDLSRTAWPDEASSLAVTSSIWLSRTPLLGLDLSMAASRAANGADRSLYVSPSIGRSFGRAHASLSWHGYRTGTDTLRSDPHGLAASLSVPLAGGFHAALRTSVLRSAAVSTDRFYLSLARSF